MNAIRRWTNLHAKVLTPVVAGLSYDAARWVSTGAFDKTNVVVTVLTGIYALLGYAAPNTTLFANPPTDRVVPSDAEVAKGS